MNIYLPCVFPYRLLPMYTLKINGHHVYTYDTLLPCLYRFRIGTGPGRIAFNGKYVLDRCYLARDRVMDALGFDPVGN